MTTHKKSTQKTHSFRIIPVKYEKKNIQYMFVLYLFFFLNASLCSLDSQLK